MQKKKYSTKTREIKRLIWIVVLNVALLLLFFNLKSHNEQTYCFARVYDKWFYGHKQQVESLYVQAHEVRKIDFLFSNITSSYKPTFEEIIEKNEEFIICQLGDWKNAKNNT